MTIEFFTRTPSGYLESSPSKQFDGKSFKTIETAGNALKMASKPGIYIIRDKTGNEVCRKEIEKK